MRGISLFLIGVLVALAQRTDRPGTLQSGTATITSNGVGYHFRYLTVVEPPPANMSVIRIAGGVTVDHNAVHREMTDYVHHEYFGYDLRAVPGPGVGQYSVTISPLTIGSITATPVPLPKYPPLTLVNEGDTIALDLLVSADGKQKVVDYIQVSGLSNASPATTTSEPRDYTPDDGTVRINGDPMTVLVNGQTITSTTGLTIKPGATIWLSAPKQGRYILSLLPHDGFQKAGVIRDNVISFQLDGPQYEVRTADPILGSKGAWNLFILHDPQYQSRNTIIAIGLDRLDNLLPKR